MVYKLSTLLHRRFVLGIIIYILLTAMFPMMIFTRLTALAFTSELHIIYPDITETQIGAFTAVYFYCYAPLQPFMGTLTDRVGPKWIVVASCVLFFTACLIVGLTTSLPVAYVGRALAGIGASAYVVPFTRLLTLWFVPKQFILLLAINKTISGILSIIATVPFIYLVSFLNEHYPGKALMIFMCALGTWASITGILFAAIGRDTPVKFGYPPVEREKSLAEKETQPQNPSESEKDLALTTVSQLLRQQDKELITGSPPTTPKMTMRTALKMTFISRTSAQLYLILVMSFFNQGTLFAISSSLGILWIKEATGLTNILPAVMQLLIFLFSIPGGYLMSFLANRYGRRPVMLASVLLTAVEFLMQAFCTHFYPHIWWYGIIYSLLGINTMPFGSLLTTMVKESYPIEVSGTVIGCYYFFSMIGGAVFQIVNPALVQHVTNKRMGYAYAGYISFGVSIISIVLAFFVKETRKGKYVSKKQSPCPS